VSSSGLLSSGGGGDGLDGVLHDVSKLKSLNEIPGSRESSKEERKGVRAGPDEGSEGGKREDERVPDHASVLDSNLVVLVVDLVHVLNSVVQRRLGPEDGGVGLEGRKKK